MSFVSLSFFLLFPAAVLLLRRWPRARKAVLLLGMWAVCGKSMPVLLALAVGVWYLAGRKTRAGFCAGILLCLGVLLVFRGQVGVSFFALQAISYLCDTRWGLVEGQKLGSVVLYLGFFPTVVSGPVAKARDFLPQLDRQETASREDLSRGIQRFCLGLLEKTVIADRLGLCVDAVFAAPRAYSGGTIALAVLSYALQLYCDFSGYSHMAIGAARCLGFRLGENFSQPYTARSLSEFWRRWHRSLSDWFRVYVYIPLGGSRRGHTWVNLMAVMVLSGLWHGTKGTYLIWGAAHGLLLVLERLGGKRGLGKVLTFLAVCLLWIPFRAESLETAGILLGRMLTLAPGIRYCYGYSLVFVPLVLGAQAMARRGLLPEYLDLTKFWPKVVFCLGLAVTVLFACAGETAFLYAAF